jgi:hypothetical protein
MRCVVHPVEPEVNRIFAIVSGFIAPSVRIAKLIGIEANSRYGGKVVPALAAFDRLDGLVNDATLPRFCLDDFDDAYTKSQTEVRVSRSHFIHEDSEATAGIFA